MPSIKDLRKRISSVKNTQQITRAMKLVSAAKLKKSQDLVVAQRFYTEGLNSILDELVVELGESSRAQMAARINLVLDHSGNEVTQGNRELVVVVSSDRGLCGGFNSNVIKMADREFQVMKQAGIEYDVAFVGKRASEYFRLRGTQPIFSEEFGGSVSSVRASALWKKIHSELCTGKYRRVRFIYMKFRNAMTQTPEVLQVFPVDSFHDGGAPLHVSETQTAAIAEPSVLGVVEKIAEGLFVMNCYWVLLESQASEHGARMSAMESATKNAGEMIRKLSIQYNKLRQASITKELLEIISGSESQKTVA